MFSVFESGTFWVVGLAVASILAFALAMVEGPPKDEKALPVGFIQRIVLASLMGMSQIISGACVAVIKGVPWSIPIFALGFGIILTLVARNKKHRHASPTLRRVVDLADASLTSMLIAGILIVANTLAFSYAERPLDLTNEGSFTLSSQSENAIKALKRPLTFTVFLASRNASARVQQLLDLYRGVAPTKVKVETLERFGEQDRLKFDELRKRVPDVAITQGGGVVIDYGEGKAAQTVVVRDIDLFERMDAASERDPSRFESTFKGEDVITSALVRLEGGKRAKIGFLTGHGESPLEAAEASGPGLGLLKNRLESTGFQAVALSLVGEDVPAEMALVVVTGPGKPLQLIESNRLRAFMDGGGKMLVMTSGQKKTGLEELLHDYNIDLGSEVVIDPTMNLNRDPRWVAVPIPPGARHPITSSLANTYAAMPVPSAISVLGGPAGRGSKANPKPPVNPLRIPTVLLRTADSARSYVDGKTIQTDPTKFSPGPLVVGVAISERPDPKEKPSNEEPEPRLVVFSDSYMFDNVVIINSSEYNLDLINNAVNWLRGKSELVGIAPKKHVSHALATSVLLRNRLIVVPTILSLAVIICMGIFTYLSRRE